jgi:thioesterase domain-containing protein
MGYVHRNMNQKGGKAWWNFFVQDMKERKPRYITTLAAKMFSRIPASLKDTYEINSFAQRNYRKKPFPGRLTLFRASKQEREIPSDNGWGPIFLEGIEIHEIPGDHWQVLSEPGIDVLARAIGECLSRSDKPA